MRRKKRKLGMRWYNFLVYFWLPVSVFFAAVFAALGGYLTFLAVKSGLKEGLNINLILMCVYLVLVFLITLVYTAALRRNLKTYEKKAPQLLVVWYLLPILFSIGTLFIGSPLATTISSVIASETVATMISQYALYGFLGLIVAAFARAFIMILINVPYFLKREELFDDLVYMAGEDISSYFPT